MRLFFFIWENPRRVVQDGCTRPSNYQRTTASAIFLWTKPAGPVLAVPSKTAEVSAQSSAWVLFAGEAPWLAPGQSPQPHPSPRRRGRRAVPAVLCSFSARHSSPGVTAPLIRWRRLWTASAGATWGDDLQCPVNWQSTRRRV